MAVKLNKKQRETADAIVDRATLMKAEHGSCFLVIVEGDFTRMMTFHKSEDEARELAAILDMAFILAKQDMNVKVVRPAFSTEDSNDAEEVSEVQPD